MDSGPVENPENFKKYTTKKNEDYVWFLIVDDTMLHLIVFSRKELNYATPGRRAGPPDLNCRLQKLMRFSFVGNKRTEIPPRLVVHTTRTKYISRIGVSDCSSEAIIYNIIRFQVAWVLPCLNQIRVIFVGKNYYAKEKK
ncbi:hypothetical protein RCL_jg748.t1 [Rhizophagus clarus]|uniref:Uncharacterized protein n=1 Tax=Rhizophagus clarus TaxID=94130 RepID=A0A8H3QK10_9GLOM|nr:hypothetical protein RCL_jg748.t1 [Rhizophagus clarus]